SLALHKFRFFRTSFPTFGFAFLLLPHRHHKKTLPSWIQQCEDENSYRLLISFFFSETLYKSHRKNRGDVLLWKFKHRPWQHPHAALHSVRQHDVGRPRFARRHSTRRARDVSWRCPASSPPVIVAFPFVAP